MAPIPQVYLETPQRETTEKFIPGVGGFFPPPFHWSVPLDLSQVLHGWVLILWQ